MLVNLVTTNPYNLERHTDRKEGQVPNIWPLITPHVVEVNFNVNKNSFGTLQLHAWNLLILFDEKKNII